MTKPLHLQGIAVFGFYPSLDAYTISITPANIEFRDCGGSYGITRNITIDTVENIPLNKFLSVEDALNYWYDSEKNNIVDAVNTALGSVLYSLGDRVAAIGGVIEQVEEDLSEIPPFDGTSDDIDQGEVNLFLSVEDKEKIDNLDENFATAAQGAKADSAVQPAGMETAISDAINALLDGAPTALNTLKELADKLGEEGDAVAALTLALEGKQDSIDPMDEIANSENDAAEDAPTDLNPITTLLGVLTGELNDSNARYNALAEKYNDLSTKFNTLLSGLKSKGLMED